MRFFMLLMLVLGAVGAMLLLTFRCLENFQRHNQFLQRIADQKNPAYALIEDSVREWKKIARILEVVSLSILFLLMVSIVLTIPS